MNEEIELSEVIGIYALIDPNDGSVGYVGKSIDIAKRYHQHIGTHDGTPKSMWVKQLLDSGQKPGLKLLERCENSELDDRETYWMSFFMESGESSHNVSKRIKANPRKVAPTTRIQFVLHSETACLLEAMVFLHGNTLSTMLNEMTWKYVNDNCKESFDLFKVMLKKRGIDFNSELASRTR